MKRNEAKEKLPLTQKAAHGVGHVLNDLAANVWFSYLLIYLTKVAGLSNSHTGYVAMSGQVIDGFCTPVIAILNDKTVCRYGRRKIWHLVGWALVCIMFPLLFTHFLPHDTTSALKLAYYIGIAGVFQFGWGCMQISHLSLIPEISRRESERVELNAIRSALRFLCGIFVFGVTWILLGRSNEKTISHNTWKQFMNLSIIIIGTGSVFNLIFHIWTKEPPSEALLQWKEKKRPRKQRKEKEAAVDQLKPSGASAHSTDIVATVSEEKPRDKLAKEDSFTTIHSDDPDEGRTRTQWLKKPELYKVGLIYIGTRLYVNISQVYFPLYLVETMKFEKESVAYFPLVVLVAGVLASVGMKPLTKRIGSKTTFCLGAMMAVSASCWFKVQPINSRDAVYGPAVLMGSGGSVMLVTSLSLIAHMIGHDKKSGAFVYGAIGFFDKVVSGVVIAVIQETSPRTDHTAECLSCDEFLRNVQSIVPAAPVALTMLFVIFDSAFLCRRRVQVSHIATQTNPDVKDIEDVKYHTVVVETSGSRFCVFENEGLRLSDENLLACPTDFSNHEDRELNSASVDIEANRTDLSENITDKVVGNEAVSKSLANDGEHDITKPNMKTEHVETSTEGENKGNKISQDANNGTLKANSHEYKSEDQSTENGTAEASPNFNDTLTDAANSAPTGFEDQRNKDMSLNEDVGFRL